MSRLCEKSRAVEPDGLRDFKVMLPRTVDQSLRINPGRLTSDVPDTHDINTHAAGLGNNPQPRFGGGRLLSSNIAVHDVCCHRFQLSSCPSKSLLKRGIPDRDSKQRCFDRLRNCAMPRQQQQNQHNTDLEDVWVTHVFPECILRLGLCRD